MQSELLDDFRDLSGWSAIASGQAQLELRPERGATGAALRLDFDFRGGSGFVVARRSFARALPTSFALRFRLRGEAAPLRFELKLVDASGRNVWWQHRDGFAPPRDWQPMRIRSRELDFAWGPQGGGSIRELGALELAVAAGSGGAPVEAGRGSLFIDALWLEDLDPKQAPRLEASSAAAGAGAERACDGRSDSAWRSADASAPQWLALDFGEPRELGGLIVDWEPGCEASDFALQVSPDGERWTTRFEAREALGPRSYLPLPDLETRFLRLWLERAAGSAGFGVRELRVQPHEFSRSQEAFLQAVAAHERRGLFPRFVYREQSYWTPVGIEARSAPALQNEEGLVEVDRGSFSLEPFVWDAGRLVCWADVSREPLLADGELPIPSSRWHWSGMRLTTTAFPAGVEAPSALLVRYRLENTGAAQRSLRFFAALRPFQATPPWQAFRGLGGVSPVHELAFRDAVLWVNGDRPVVPLSPPDAAGVSAFAQGPIPLWLARGALPARSEVQDASGQASGALAFDLELAPGEAREIDLALPYPRERDGLRSVADALRLSASEELERATQHWRERLAQVELSVPDVARDAVRALRSATAQVLIQRDGPALQPGPRRYTRSWIRDGALMAAALLRMGVPGPVRDFLRWYARYQAPDGNVPCCVDAQGPDWLPEHDSHGQWLFAIAEQQRLAGDRALLAELWPGALRAVDTLEALRNQRVTARFERGELRARHGLLPESASHEGYLAHPVHSYWDDFWALRGLGDAAELAGMQGDAAARVRIAALAAALRQSVYASIETTMAERAIDTVPASVEWADFDPVATAAALVWTDAAAALPADALARSCDTYLAGLRARARGETDWANYTPYEIRMVAALVRLGRRVDAHEVLDFLLADRRPRAWNQWPEIAWRDPRSPAHLGDLPHSWIGAEYVLALLSLFAFERPGDQALVLAAGVPEHWLREDAALGVARLPTYWGPLRYSLRRRGETALELSLSALAGSPPGGIELRPPLPRRLERVSGDLAAVARSDAESVTLARSPARVVLHF